METLYRKVAVNEKLPEFGQRVIALVLEQNDLGLSKFLWNVSYSDITKSFKMDGNTVQIEYWLEEIPDPTAQLKADKAELLEALAKVKRLEPIICIGGAVAEQWQNEAQALNEMMSGIESLIKKHKQ